MRSRHPLEVLAALMLVCVGPHAGAMQAAESMPEESRPPATLPRWSQGDLEIHHINTGRGNATFFILPDGTTMLFDAGDLDSEEFTRRAAPLQLVPQRPSAAVSPGAAIAKFILQVAPRGTEARIDYALVSHFHSDHYGAVRAGLPRAASGKYVLSGITEVGDIVPIELLLDRGFPDYDVPVKLDAYHGESFRNYLAFQHAQQAEHGLRVARLQAGSARQIVLKHDPDRYPDFEIRNIKSGEQLWSGCGERIERLFDPAVLLDGQSRFSENPLSLAIRVSFGRFAYFIGGDSTGLAGTGIPEWFDVETPVAKVTGPVDVLALNHHGNRDATNENFLSELRPRVIVQQAWTSDQPGGEVLHRLISQAIWPGERDIFSTAMTAAARAAIGPPLERSYLSFEGHVVIRVQERGERYRVFVLDDTNFDLRIKAMYGPYVSRAGQSSRRAAQLAGSAGCIADATE